MKFASALPALLPHRTQFSFMEGPQVQLYARQLDEFIGRQILRLGGDRRQVVERVRARYITQVQPLGKLLFLRISDTSAVSPADFYLRLHCLMFGDIRINRTRPGKRLTLRLGLDDGTRIYLYLGAARIAELDEVETRLVDRDIAGGKMPTPDLLKDFQIAYPETLVADALLDQQWFPGLGNKIKCEALHAAGIHPAREMGDLSDSELDDLSRSTRDFTQAFEAAIFRDGDRGRPAYKIFRRRRCGRCDQEAINQKLGQLHRSCHHCPVCQPVNSG